MRICRETKAFYDTEFQAAVVAARRSADWGVDIVPYECGSHWHIANADPKLRNKHIRPAQRDWCEYCDTHMKPGRYARHIKLPGHLRNKAKRREDFL